jgi:hexokinase
MRSGRGEAIEFLCANYMDSGQVEMESLLYTFTKEMERGLEGSGGSLLMIPTYLEADREVPLGRPVIAIDAGGTNFRVGLASFGSSSGPELSHFRNYPMPGLGEEVSSKAFFSTIAGYLEEVADLSDEIGFCFSYATAIQPSGDGRLIRFCKEVKAKEVEGQLVGERLAAALEEAGHSGTKRIVLLNDTVATLLAGRAASAERRYESYIGFILGTGTNCAYIEGNSEIAKLPGLDPSRKQIVNVESGGFGKAPRGAIDLKFDRSTVDPGQYTFEKMISGGYLGRLFGAVLAKGASEGLFSSDAAGLIGALPPIETRSLGVFLSDPSRARDSLASAFPSISDLDIAYNLAERLVERAAKLSAVNLAAIALKSGAGRDPRGPVCVTADGTTFYELKGLREKTLRFLEPFLLERFGVRCEFARVENAPMIGAAIAGLSRRGAAR